MGDLVHGRTPLGCVPATDEGPGAGCAASNRQHAVSRRYGSHKIVVYLDDRNDRVDGVVGFVEKPFDPCLLPGSVREALLRTAANAARRALAVECEARRSTLTPRENEVLALLLEGHLNKTIAGRLEMSPRTTEHHRAHIMEKMAARSLSHLIRMMLEHGR